MSLPTKVCRFGSMCFRLNSVHFDEYRHPHLEAILAKGINPTTLEYDIPITAPKEKTTQQLELLQSKLPVSEPPKKVQRIDDDVKLKINLSDSEDDSRVATPKRSSSVTKMKLEDQKPSTSSKFISSPGISALQRKQDEKEFFKERSEAFKAKNPGMRPASPAPRPRQNTFNPQKEEQLEAAMKHFLPVILPRGQMADKLRKAAPYNMFLTTVTAAPATHSDPTSITFQELLDPSLGELESSVQLNFMVDLLSLVKLDNNKTTIITNSSCSFYSVRILRESTR